jgi:histidine phosphotransferase ChpT
MTIAIDIRVAELLAARLCHELISPIAAVGNGVELLGEEDADFVRDALSLVADSAQKAARRLQFYRFAFGFAGSGALAGPPPHQLAAEFFADTRVVCDYPEAARNLPLPWQKLACNLLAVGAEALPRGGHLRLDAIGDGAAVDGEGEGAMPSPEMRSALALATPVEELGSRTIGAYFAGLLAAALGRNITVTGSVPGRFRLSVAPT